MTDKKDKQGKKAPEVIRIEAGDETTEKKHVSAADKPLQSDKYLNDDFIKTVTGENNAALKAAEAQLKLCDDIIRKVTGKNNTVLKAIQETWENNNRAINRLQTDIAERTAAIAEAWKNGATQKAIEELTPALKQLQAYLNSEAYQTIYKYNTVALKKNTEVKENAAPGEDVELLPDSDFIGVVLSEYQERGELQEDISVAQIIKESYTETGERTDSNTYTELLKRAAELYTEYDKDPAAFEEKFEAEQQEKINIKKVTAKRITKQDFPLDKINSTAWKIVTENPDGQYAANYATLTDPKKPTVLYSLNFDKLQGEGDLKIAKKLTPYDRRVYNAIGALFNGGNEVFSLSQIYPLMGYSGRPGKDDIKKIHDSVIKMKNCTLTIDNTTEHDITKGKYAKITYNGYLLPIEILTAEINGILTKGAIHAFREPPLISFARARKQITTIQSILLQTGLSNTENNIILTDYLIEYIGALKRPKNTLSKKITLDTLYKNCGITTKNHKSRAPEKIKTILTGFKQKAFIKSFTMTKEAVTFNV